MLNAGIFVFYVVDVLDFAGSFEVFSRTRLVPGVEPVLNHRGPDRRSWGSRARLPFGVLEWRSHRRNDQREKQVVDFAG
jgi:hypothetical protein